MNDPEPINQLQRPRGLPFHIGKLGHVVLNVRDVERSARFYTQVLGFKVSDVYRDEMVPGGMVFRRCNPAHHGRALVGSMEAEAANVELNHIAFEVATLDEVIRARDHLRRHGVTIDFAGRRRAGCQLAVEFRDPDNHRLEIYWGIDQIGTDRCARPPSEWKGAQSLAEAIANPVRGQDTTLQDRDLLNRC
jgi:catechol 2,3-dioxygenase-like lactoylglutathione lyase family enzyme